MTDKDPFSQSEGTVIKPRPGGRGVPAPEAPAPAADYGALELQGAGANPVLSAASTLLAVASQLRQTTRLDDTDDLFRHLCQDVRTFESRLAADGASPQVQSVARYTICGFLDEAILNTPWGSESNWGARTLLAEFHNEVYAGEKLFEILDRLKQDPGQYVDLLELIYVCLSLGFQGKYRRMGDGLNLLETIRSDLYSVISRQRAPAERALSPHWEGVTDTRPGLVRYVPWWVVAAVAGAIAVVTFFVLLRLLGVASDPLAHRIATIGNDLPSLSAPPPPPPTARSFVSEMSAEIAANADTEAGSDANTVIFRGLFNQGSTTIAADGRATLETAARVLETLPGRVIVTGHTDNVPIRSIRFPSNWELSKARAQAVVDLLVRQSLPAERIVAEPRADSEPYCATCDQNNAGERANNRRVEIRLLPTIGAR